MISPLEEMRRLIAEHGKRPCEGCDLCRVRPPLEQERLVEFGRFFNYKRGVIDRLKTRAAAVIQAQNHLGGSTLLGMANELEREEL